MPGWLPGWLFKVLVKKIARDVRPFEELSARPISTMLVGVVFEKDFLISALDLLE